MKKINQTNRQGYRISLLFFAVGFIFISCNNDNNQNQGATNPSTQAQLVDSNQQFQQRSFYTVELSKAELQRIFRSIPLNPSGKTKGKLILQFSSSNVTNSKDFDLSIFITPRHKDYAERKTPFLAKAVARHLEIKPNEQYILGNNEKSLKELKKILKNVTWTKIVFYPYIDAARQLRYMVIPHNGTTALKNIQGLTEADLSFLTNPSPPAKPYHEDDPDDPNDPDEPDTVILD